MYIDIGNELRWQQFVDETLSTLSELIDRGAFRITRYSMVKDLAGWANARSTLDTIRSGSGLTHGDLTGDNVFLLPDGFRVIDWQRPRLAPPEVDLALLLDGFGFDPLKHVQPNIVGISLFLHVNWCVECKARWFPQGSSYDRYVADFARKIVGLPA